MLKVIELVCTLLTTLMAVAAAILTATYVVFTYRIMCSAQESSTLAREQLESLTRPILVVAVVVRPGPPVFQLSIRNEGQAAARNVYLRIEPDLLPFHGKSPTKKRLKELPAFRERIDSFTPKTELLIDLGMSFDFFSLDPQIRDVNPLQFAVSAFYQSDSKTYTETTGLDLEIFRGSTAAKYGVLGELADLNKNIEKRHRSYFYSQAR